MKTTCQLLLLSLVLLAVACVPRLYAQESRDDEFEFFPYSVGDRWRVRNADNPADTFTSVVLRDSTDSSGTRFLFLNSGIYSIDTAGDIYINPAETSRELHYRLRATPGERWRLKSDNSDSAIPFYVTYMGSGQENVLGQMREVKVFNYWYDASAGGLSDSMWYLTRSLARGIGVMQEYYEPDAFFYTSGAIIGGEAYGDMIASVGADQPSLLHAAHVAPNPFTEGATLSYQLDRREYVRLTISDARGKVVATPVDEVQEAGEQTATIDGGNLLDGTYFYQLQTPSHTHTGTLIRQR